MPELAPMVRNHQAVIQPVASNADEVVIVGRISIKSQVTEVEYMLAEPVGNGGTRILSLINGTKGNTIATETFTYNVGAPAFESIDIPLSSNPDDLLLDVDDVLVWHSDQSGGGQAPDPGGMVFVTAERVD